MSIFMLAQAQDGAAAPAAPVTTATESVPAGQPAPEQPNIFEQIFGGPMFMFVVIIILFWVMLIRPQRKAQKEQQARIASLQRGDKVVTNAGLHGFIEKVNDRTVSLKIAEGVIVELEKNAIVHVEKYSPLPRFPHFQHPSCAGRRQGADVYFETVFSWRG